MSPNAFRPRRAGFTLIEVAVATVVIAIGVAALLTSMAAGTRTNKVGRDLTQAVLLAQELREYALGLPFSEPDEGQQGGPPGAEPGESAADDLDDLMGATFSPPIDAGGDPINELPHWSQSVSLSWRQAEDLATVVPPGTSDVVRVEVSILFRGEEVLSRGWLATPEESQ